MDLETKLPRGREPAAMTRSDFILLTAPYVGPRKDEPLVVLDYTVNKSDPQELYAALCWIEANLIGLATRRAQDAQRALDRARVMIVGLGALAAGLGAVALFHG